MGKRQPNSICGTQLGKKGNLTEVFKNSNSIRFKTITSAYYKGCNGIMLVYDITDLHSFENIENWLDKCKLNCPNNVTMMLVGNKSDLEDQRQVSKEAAA